MVQSVNVWLKNYFHIFYDCNAPVCTMVEAEHSINFFFFLLLLLDLENVCLIDQITSK